MLRRYLARPFVLASLFLALATLGFSQNLDTVTITGKVTDSNGLAVVGAAVTATLSETGETRTVTTNDDGNYRIVALKPGTYVISGPVRVSQ